MAAAPPPSLQQQLAEVEEAARKAGLAVLVQAAWMGRHNVLAHLLCTASDDGGGGGVSQEQRSAAFLAAASEGHEQCLRVLLEASPSPASAAELLQAADYTTYNEFTALMLAACLGHVGCVRLLLQHSPDAQVSYRTQGGCNVLMVASYNGTAECVALLLQHSPDAQVAAAADSGYTAAVIAAEYGRLSCLQLVLEHSPQQQRLDKALAFAARKWGRQLQGQRCGGGTAYVPPLQPYQRYVELLLSKGAMLTAQTLPEAFPLVRSVVQDLAARALVPDMAKEAVVKSAHEARLSYAHVASAAAALAADTQPVVARAGGKPEQQQGQGRKRGHASRGSNIAGGHGRRTK